LKGLAGPIVSAGTDAAMDVAFGDPQADRAVLGTDLTPSLYLGVRGPGIIGSTARGMNATRFGVGAAHPGGAMAVGGLAGAAGGAGLGYRMGGAKGALIGGVIGAFGGGAVGGGAQAVQAYRTARTNSQIMNESPFYNQSALTADRLNASGNIVLGMHNQRRG